MFQEYEKRNREMRDKRKKGQAIDSLAKEYGVTPKTIRRICVGVALERPRQLGRMSDDEVFQHLKPFLEKTRSSHVIAKLSRVSQPRVCEILQKFGYSESVQGAYKAPTSESMQAERDRVDALMAERGGYEDDPRACRPMSRRWVSGRGATFQSSAHF